MTTISIPCSLLDSTLDTELELDAALPESCPDIARLIRVDCTPFVEKCVHENDRLLIGGKAVYDILYEAEGKSHLRFCNMTQDFSHSVPVKNPGIDGIYANAEVNCRHISCRMLSPRKLLLKALLGTKCEIEYEKSISAVSVTENGDSFFKKKVIGFDGICESHSENHSFSEDLTLSQAEKNVGEIVFCKVNLSPAQVTVQNGSADIRVNAEISVLYEGENSEGEYIMSTKNIPLTFPYTNEKLEPHKKSIFALKVTESGASKDYDQYGESRILRVSFNVRTTAHIREPKAYTVATDMFSIGSEDVITIDRMSVPVIYDFGEKSFTAEASLPATEPRILEILSSDARCVSTQADITEEGVKISGTLVACIMGRTDDGIYSFDHAVPFENHIPLETEGIADIKVTVTPFDIIPTLHSDGGIAARLICSASIDASGRTEEEYVSAVTQHPIQKSGSDEYFLIYRFCDSNDTLWDIAKEYKVDPDELAQTNENAFEGQSICKTPIVIRKR